MTEPGSTALFTAPLLSIEGDASGTAEVSASATHMVFNDLVVQLPGRNVLGVPVDSPRAFLTEPFVATIVPGSRYWADAGTAALLLTSVVGGVSQGFRATNSTPLSGDFDQAAGLLSLNGTFTSGLVTAEVELRFRFLNRPPVAVAVLPTTAECSAPGRASVRLSAAGTSDPDGVADIVRYLWRIDANTPGEMSANGAEVDVELPLGTHEVDLFVFDRRGSYGSTRSTVVALDTTGPDLSFVELTPSCLWPASHRYVPFQVGIDVRGVVSDLCHPGTGRLQVLGVSSSQPDDGTGDGDTSRDVAWSSDRFCLRAERSGGDPTGRRYTVLLGATDGVGNHSTTQVTVGAGVAHDQSGAKCPPLPQEAFVADDDPRCPLPVEESPRTEPASPAAARTLACAAIDTWTGAYAALVVMLFARRRHRGFR